MVVAEAMARTSVRATARRVALLAPMVGEIERATRDRHVGRVSQILGLAHHEARARVDRRGTRVLPSRPEMTATEMGRVKPWAVARVVVRIQAVVEVRVTDHRADTPPTVRRVRTAQGRHPAAVRAGSSARTPATREIAASVSPADRGRRQPTGRAMAMGMKYVAALANVRSSSPKTCGLCSKTARSSSWTNPTGS